MDSNTLGVLIGLLLMIQVGGMLFANFFSVMDRLMGIRWLWPVGVRPRVWWSLPFFFVVWVATLIFQNAVYGVFGLLPAFEDKDQSSLRAILTITVCNAVSLLVIPILVGPGWGDGLKRLGMMGPDLARQFRVGVRMAWLISPYVYMVNLMANLYFEQSRHDVMKMLERGLSSLTIVLSAVTAVILAPIVEEMLFRGLLLGALVRKSAIVPAHRRRLLVMGANVVTSLFFAILHIAAWPSPIGIFLLSLGLGKLYVATGRLWPCIAAHAVFNLTGILGMIAAVMFGKEQALAFLLP